MSNPSNKFQLVPYPPESPWKCIGCLESNKPMIDWRYDLEFYGAVYMCVDCVTEAASTLGLVSTEVFQGLKKRAEDVEAYLGKIHDIVNRAGSDLSDLGTDFRVVVDPGNILVPTKPELTETVSEDSGSEPESEPSGDQQISEFTFR